MLTKKVGVKKTKKILRRIVNQYGHEYVYQLPMVENEDGSEYQSSSCMYTEQSGQPSCIVGHVLAEAAPAMLKKLHTHEWSSATVLPTSPTVYEIENCLTEGNIKLSDVFTEGAVRLLGSIQQRQDSGSSWGSALDQVSRMY